MIAIMKKDIAICEFCGESFPLEELESTSFCGPYCKDCLELMILEAQQAIANIETRKVINGMVAYVNRDKD